MNITCTDRKDLIVIYEIIKSDAESKFGKQNTYDYEELKIILDMTGINSSIGQVNKNIENCKILELHLPVNLNLQTSAHLGLFAHEVVHTLRYTGEQVIKLEEGAATWFGKQYAEGIRSWPSAEIWPDKQNYKDVFSLFNGNKDALIEVIKDKFNNEDATFLSLKDNECVTNLNLNEVFIY